MGETAFAIHRKPNPQSAAERAAVMQNLGFGRIFTEHMVSVRYSVDGGWHAGKLEPYAPITL
ncbi:MAG: hypothetical protein QM756_01020 [Polyangiaceae bacterium]